MHYLPIHNFNRLMVNQHSKHQHKTFFCHHCLHGFCREDLLEKHIEMGCSAIEGSSFTMPDEGEDEMKFKNIYNQVKSPFSIYLDFEALPVPTIEGSTTESEGNSIDSSSESKTVKLAEHKVISFCFKVQCAIPGFEFEPVLYRGEAAIERLYHELKRVKRKIDKLIRMNVPIFMTPEQRKEFRTTDTCIFCQGKQGPLGNDRVRDHCHLTGAYRGAAHKMCNIRYHFINMKIPVFCHNMKGYDSHFIIKQAHAFEARKINVIASNSE